MLVGVAARWMGLMAVWIGAATNRQTPNTLRQPTHHTTDVHGDQRGTNFAIWTPHLPLIMVYVVAKKY